MDINRFYDTLALIGSNKYGVKVEYVFERGEENKTNAE